MVQDNADLWTTGRHIGSMLDGFSNHLAQTITIHDQGFDEQRITLVHEMLHSVEHLAHFKVEDEIIDIMATWIVDILRNNPELVDWLREE